MGSLKGGERYKLMLVLKYNSFMFGFVVVMTYDYQYDCRP